MSDVATQLHEYFESAVERVTVDDVMARCRVTEPAATTPWWRHHTPAWVTAVAFVTTVLVLGGSVVLGAVLQSAGHDAGAWLPTGRLGNGSSNTSALWLLVPLMALLVAGGTGLLAHTHNKTRKGTTMTTTVEREAATRPGTTGTTTRRLAITVVILAIALVALGTWVAIDLASEPATAVSDEVAAAIDDYVAAWEAGDSSAFLAATTDDFTFSSQGQVVPRSQQAQVVATLSTFRHTTVGDLIAMGDGPEFYVAVAAEITWLGQAYEGVSAFRVIDTDAGLKVAEHSWVGNF